MSKISTRALKTAKARADVGIKSNFTFRINIKSLGAFKKKCDKNGFSMSEVIEAFMDEVASPSVNRIIIK